MPNNDGIKDFKVVCDESNNSPEDVKNNVLNVDISIRPLNEDHERRLLEAGAMRVLGKQEPILLITPSLEKVGKWLKLHGLDGPNRAFRVVYQPTQMMGWPKGTKAYDYGESHNFMYLYDSEMFEQVYDNKLHFTWLDDGVQFLEAVAKWHEQDKAAKPEVTPSITVPVPSPMQDTTKWPVDPRVEHVVKDVWPPPNSAGVTGRPGRASRTLRVIDLSEHKDKTPKKVALFQPQDLFWLVIFGAILASVIYFYQ